MDEEATAPPAPDSPPPAPDAAPSESREPPTLETALTWLATVKPALVLATLREPEFALVSVSAFAGFRVNATGYANPLVRRRLAAEAIRDEKFAEKLRALAAEAILSVPPPPTRPAEKPAAVNAPPPRDEALRADRDRRKRERDEARKALSVTESARSEAESAKRNAEAERDEVNRLAQRQMHRIERLERQITKLQTEQAALLRALRQQSAPPAPRHEAESEASASPSSPTLGAEAANPWQSAVAHLLDKRKFDAALGLAEDVLREAPEDVGALDIAAQGHAGRGEPRLAALLLRRLLTARLSQGNVPEAAETLLRLLRLDGSPTETERDVRTFLAALRPDDEAAVAQTRGVLARLRGLAPDAQERLAAQIRALAVPALAEALIPTPGLPGADDPLPLPTLRPLTARSLLRAVDAGEVETIGEVRAILAQLCERAPEDHTRVRQALERAAGEDASYLVTIFGRERGPVVVDGSNAAWFDQEALAAGRPRLRSLLGLRRALRAQGYFPILLYADAPLPYTIDEPEQLREMVARGEIAVVDGGVDADEILLREAKHHSAPLVTNDYMNDWDPLHEVRKIRYTVAASGEAYLLPWSGAET